MIDIFLFSVPNHYYYRMKAVDAFLKFGKVIRNVKRLLFLCYKGDKSYSLIPSQLSRFNTTF